MEWHTLDGSLRRNQVIEGFESFIWTERYSGWGDFQIKTRSTSESRALLVKGVNIGMNESFRVMTIETVDDSVDEEGKKILTLTGRSIERWLEDRAAMPSMSGLAVTPQWAVTGTPGNIARYMFSQICVNHVLSANDVLPFYTAGTFLPAGSIEEPADSVTISFEPATLYSNIQQVCDIWLLGFRLVKKQDLGEIYFDIYTGDDRTSAQSDNPVVIFSADMESIDQTSVLISDANLKTAAYVFAQNGTAMIYAPGYDSSVSGDKRRILVVNASDIDEPAGSTLDQLLAQKGMEELAKYRDIHVFDGVIPEHQPFIYGTDYNLGDVVEERGPDGLINQMLVTEQIFVSDGEGERSYPTLIFYRPTSVPGTWSSRIVTEHWDDVSLEEHWGDL